MQKLIILSSLVVLFLTACTKSDDDSSSTGENTENNSAVVQACNVIGLQTRILNGTTCNDSLGSSIARVLQYDANGDLAGICSGTLITPTKVLTATHCFLQDGFYQVVIGESENFEATNIVSINPAPGFRVGGPETSNRVFNDATIANLETPLSSPVMPILLSRTANINETGYVFGFGVTEEGSASLATLQGGSMVIREITPNHIFVRFDGSGVNVCNGDSGGPLIVDINGQPAVAGIVSQGNIPDCRSGDVTTFTNLQSDSVLPWLAGAAGDATMR